MEVFKEFVPIQFKAGQTIYFQEEEFNNFCVISKGKVLTLLNREKPFMGSFYTYKTPSSLFQHLEESFDIMSLEHYNRYFDIQNRFLHFIIDIKGEGDHLDDFNFLSYDKRWLCVLLGYPVWRWRMWNCFICQNPISFDFMLKLYIKRRKKSFRSWNNWCRILSRILSCSWGFYSKREDMGLIKFYLTSMIGWMGFILFKKVTLLGNDLINRIFTI